MSNQIRKQFSLMFVFVLMQIGVAAALAATPPSPPPPPPPTLTVTDTRAPEPPVFHWDTFSTVCDAAVANAPQSTTETTVTGPDYQWSCSNPSPGFGVTNDDSASTTLFSNPGSELTAGSNDVTVYCTATYSSTDKKTGVVTPIQVSGSTDVTFFVRKPVQVIQLSNINHTNNAGDPSPGTQSPYSQPGYYGHNQDYHLQMRDNQGQVYPKGGPREEFVQGSISEGPPPADSYMHGQPNGPQGPSSSFPGTNADFIDYIGFTSKDNLAALYGWNVVTLAIQFDQKWWCDESPHTTPLNTFHIQNDYQTATRN